VLEKIWRDKEDIRERSLTSEASLRGEHLKLKKKGLKNELYCWSPHI
jgi:hypothetical protein